MRIAVIRTWIVLAMAMALVALAGGAYAMTATATTSHTPPVLPTADPFYTWSDSLAGVAPGTVLRRRTVTLVPGVGGVSTATQVLYRTTDQLGRPTVTVATIIRPTAAAGATKIVSYQTAYDALGAQCDPSYTLAGGNGSFDSAETAVMGEFVRAGDTVVVSDYEGVRLEYGAGEESGYQTLDGVRAAEHAVGAPASTPVGMVGYSGGSIATQFASELAPRYAPGLDIAGVAEGGIPVDLAHNLRYVDGSKLWSSATPGILVGVARAYGIDLDRYASAYGRKLFAAVRTQCLAQYLGRYPGLRVAQLFQSGFKDYDEVPAFATLTNDLEMGRTGTPKGPLLMGVGNADGTGDGVMVAKDVSALAREYCRRGVSVDFHEYAGDDHVEAAVPFLLSAVSFLQARIDRQPVANGCSAVPPGNSLALLPVPSYRLRLRRPVTGGWSATLSSRGGTVLDAVVRITRGGRVRQTLDLRRLDARPRRFVLKLPTPGRCQATISQAGVVLARLQVAVVVSRRAR